jgi:hypothetical protein
MIVERIRRDERSEDFLARNPSVFLTVFRRKDARMDVDHLGP